MDYDLIKRFFLQNLLDKWKMLARELDVDESDIDMISREKISTKEKFSFVSLTFVCFCSRTTTTSRFVDFGYRG